jgi:energy-coupling factor transport system permease protein
VWGAGRRRPHTVYRPMPWAGRDWVVSVGAFVTMVVFLVEIPGIERSSIYYYPYPSLTWPDFSLVVGVSTWGLLGPAVVWLAAAMGRS